MKRDAKVSICFLFALALIYLCYFPALSGPFIFDDFANLNYLAVFEYPITLEQIRHYLDVGHAGPTGRPISLLSFLIDAQSWPADPEPFKRNSILFHLINVALVFWSASLILWFTTYRENRYWIALLASVCWGVNPYLVSSVAYPVQRMTILSAFFSLITFIGYIKLRMRYGQAENLAARRAGLLFFLLLTIVVGTTLSVLAKENGALTPVFLLLIELFFIGRHNPISNASHRALLIALLSAVLIALLYKIVSVGYQYWSIPPSHRDFNAVERLMTEGRLLWFYLGNLFLPGTSYPGIYIAPIDVSRSLFSPVTTGISLVFFFSGLFVSYLFRKKYVLLSFSFLFFIFGHLIESTTIMLELYFEHRNYLPSVFLWLAPAAWLTRWGCTNKSLILIPVAYLAWQAGSLISLANIWGNETRLNEHWAEVNPSSIRALASASLYLADVGEYGKAISLARKSLDIQGTSPNGMLLNAYLDCKLNIKPNVFTKDFYREVEFRLKKTKYTLETMNYLSNLYQYHNYNQCEQIDYGRLFSWLSAYENSAGADIGARLGPILHLKGKVMLEMGDPRASLENFLQSFNVWKNMDTAMVQVAALGNKSYSLEADQMLTEVEQCYTNVSCKNSLRLYKDYSEDLEYLRTLIDADMTSLGNKE